MIIHRSQQPITADEFLLLENKGFELVDGRLKEKNVGAFASKTAVWILSVLFSRFDWQKFGEFLDSEGGYQCWPEHPDRVRKPDISFIRTEKLEQGIVPDGWLKAPPDLAIEVMSKKDALPEVEVKVQEYLDVGVPLIWVVHPRRKTIRVYRGSMTPQVLRGDDEIVDEVVLPGFQCRAAELFPPR